MIHPLKPENHDDQLINIAGYICQDQSVNVDNAVEIGKQIEEDFFHKSARKILLHNS